MVGMGSLLFALGCLKMQYFQFGGMVQSGLWELGRADWDFFLTICWALWEMRNQKLFGGRRVEALEVIRLARRICGSSGVLCELDGGSFDSSLSLF
ncbi:UNVERIFIED_CONTAM: hypothetical protein Sradi_3172400 [Sesamum radiatum]|uniref:Uncharacterized protein n=1 Tax=Sesamum radiatum TaxID=300843 RepID=A0AAW2RF57_SESRA